MKNISQWIVEHKKIIIISFFCMTIISAICKPLIFVDYDMNNYLPKESPSSVALNVMETEFDGDIPNVRVMISDVTIPEALDYKEKLLAVNGVEDVIWLDNSMNMDVPLETQDKHAVETFYVDNCALFTVTVSDEDTISTVHEIRAIIGEENMMTGNAVATAVATENTVSEIAKITVLAVIIVFLVLCVTTTSWIEPILVLIGLGVSVTINNGTNLLFGEISFVTNAAGSILQIAVSLDYSIFILHRFEEYRKTETNDKVAMIKALQKTTTSILSSGLTTVIGFLALTLMKFRIGPDLGFALAKGVTFSLITVIFFMPPFILAFSKYLDKTHHRAYLSEFKGLGSLVRRICIPMVCLFAIIVIPSYLASNANDYYYGAEHIYNEDTQYGKDTENIHQIFGKNDTYVLMVPKGDFAIEARLSDELHELSKITNIVSYVDTVGMEVPVEYLSETQRKQLLSDNYSRMVLSVKADTDSKDAFTTVEDVRGIAQKYYPDSYYLAGAGVSTYDLMDTITQDMTYVNVIAIGGIFLVLLLTMRSISLPAILVLCIEGSIWMNMASPYFMGNIVFYISYLIISSVQLGATVDYAILFTRRYIENRKVLDKKQAISTTVSNVTLSILTSATVMASVGFLLGAISTHGILKQLGNFLGFGTILSFICVLFVLPGFLFLFDWLIEKTTYKAEFKKSRRKNHE